ncbi:MAG: hypothetical protein QNI90_11800 [Dinoroseobacter sp.]|nr:hypothetical protein [Dinoroseobacter sp.]
MSSNFVQVPAIVREVDPRGLVREAYRIEGITLPDCRTIFLDWSLGDTGDVAQREAVSRLLVHYGADAPDHPMTQVLRSAMAAPPDARRRGGAKARRRD